MCIFIQCIIYFLYLCLCVLPIIAEFAPLGKPVLEILFPSNGQMLTQTDLDIEITIRDRMFPKPLEELRLCIGMNALYIPEGVKFEDGTTQLKETCFEQSTRNLTTFHVSGLVPGLSYGVIVGLVNRGKVVAISMRNFEVGSIHIPTLNLNMSVSDALETALQLHQSMDRENAVAIYRDILALQSNHLHALHLLGLAIYQEGNVQEAIPYIQRAVEGNSTDENFQNSLGLCLKQLGRTHEAILHFKKAVKIRPFCVEASLNLGDAWHALGKWEEALHEYQQVVERLSTPEQLSPNHEKFVKDATGRICELLRVVDGWYDAEECLQEAMTKWPTDGSLRNDYGNLLLHAGRIDQALAEYQKAADHGSLRGMLNAADMMEGLGEGELSIVLYNKVLEVVKENEYPLLNVRITQATVLPRILPGSQEEIDHARSRVEAEIDKILENVDTMRPGKIDPSRIAFSTAITLNSHNRNNWALKKKIGSLYAYLFQNHKVIEEYFSSYAMLPLPYRQSMVHIKNKVPNGRLRVGFVSRFLFNPAVGLFMDELIPHFDPFKYETFAFAIGSSKSMKVVEKLNQIAETVIGLPKDLRIAREEIKAAKLDILIYPELGMDKTTFFLAFHRLAPVQAVWWGNADTSGIPTIDYFLSSEYEHANCQEHYTENVYQLKGMGIFHMLPEIISNVTSSEIRSAIMSTVNVSKDFHLYLCIESILHIHPDFDDAIKGILARDPKAHIFLAASSGRSNWKAKLLRRLSIKIGKQNAQTRIHFLMDVDQKQELTLLQTADSVLGSIHMTRPRAAIQAFTAGVPVVTWPGELWSSRITYGFYRQMRVHELIATSLEEYIDLAVRLATESEFRNTNSKRIQTMRRHIFGDTKAILEWEKFFDFSSKNQKQNSKKKKQQQQKAKKNSIKNKTKQQQQKINQDSIKTIGLIDDDEFKLKD